MRTKKIICHPNNLSKIEEISEKLDRIPDLHQIWGYEIVTDSSMAETKKTKTGKLIWNNNDFIDHSEPADLSMSWQDYVDMSLYFGWCTEEVIEELLFYEMDQADSISFAMQAMESWGRYGGMFNSGISKGRVE